MLVVSMHGRHERTRGMQTASVDEGSCSREGEYKVEYEYGVEYILDVGAMEGFARWRLRSSEMRYAPAPSPFRLVRKKGGMLVYILLF